VGRKAAAKPAQNTRKDRPQPAVPRTPPKLVKTDFGAGTLIPNGQPAEVIELWPVTRVQSALGFSQNQIYNLVKAGKLPKPVKYGRFNRWASTEINAIIRDALARRDAA
jgi:predicted DNA-binding transcriptional regulator AlpA